MARYDIFISYRRSGGYETAKHLYDLLTRDGYKVSFDIDTLRNGNFDTAIYDRIRKCKDFIIILSPGIFDRSLQKGSSAENDWVRKELAFALKENKNIIPVMLSGFGAFPSGLPADIAEVARKNAPAYTREYFNDFYRRLKHDFIQSRSWKKTAGITALTAAIAAVACTAILAATGTWTPWDRNADKAETSMGQTPDMTATSTLPDWIFTDTGGFISVAPAGLPDSDAEDFAIACSAYQWAIASGLDIRTRDTLVTDYLSSSIALPSTDFEYNISHSGRLRNGERVYSISFAQIPGAPNSIAITSVLKSTGLDNTGSISAFEVDMTLNGKEVSLKTMSSKEGKKDIKNLYLNGKILRIPSTGQYRDAEGKAHNQAGREPEDPERTELSKKIKENSSLSDTWTDILFNRLPFIYYPAGPAKVKSISEYIDGTAQDVTVSYSDNAILTPYRLALNAIKDNTLSYTISQDSRKLDEVLKTKQIQEEYRQQVNKLEQL